MIKLGTKRVHLETGKMLTVVYAKHKTLDHPGNVILVDDEGNKTEVTCDELERDYI